MPDLEKLLGGGDLRSPGNSRAIITSIRRKSDFDKLFMYLLHSERLIRMRAIDAIEKITSKRSEWLAGHEEEIFLLCKHRDEKEFVWHLALLLPRLPLTASQAKRALKILSTWALSGDSSRIVRVFSLQGIFDIVLSGLGNEKELGKIMTAMEKESIPSIRSRVRILKKKLAVKKKRTKG